MVGVMLIVVNAVGVIYSIKQFYGVASIYELLLLASIYAAAVVFTFSFIYRKTVKFRIIQSILATFFSLIFGYVFSAIFIFTYLKILS